MHTKSEQREFERYPMEFVLEVSGVDKEGKKFNEKAVLKNFSGGGANFITRQSGRYFLFQSLELTVYLPGTNDVKAQMRGPATVVRIDPPSRRGGEGKNEGPGVAVKFDTPLKFKRFDLKADLNGRQNKEGL